VVQQLAPQTRASGQQLLSMQVWVAVQQAEPQTRALRQQASITQS
jgi:hypothetical protein